MQRTSEVDFSVVQKMQITYNECIYNTTLVLNESNLTIDFIDGENLLCGANVLLTENKYEINYMDMAFRGEKTQLVTAFLPCIIYNFIFSFEDKIILDSYDKERECFYLKKNVNGYFITLECYETDDNKLYSMEIK